MVRRPGFRASIALLFLLPAALALVFRDFFREALVVPLLYGLWLGYEYVRSLPQAALWALFLVVGLAWILRGGLRGSAKRRPGSGKPKEEEPPGRVAVWRERVQLARRSRGGYGERYLANRLAKLALQVLADGRRIEPGRLRRELLGGHHGPGIPDEALRAIGMASGFTHPPESPAHGAFDPETLLQVLETELRLTRSERSQPE